MSGAARDCRGAEGPADGRTGILCAMEPELGSLSGAVSGRRHLGGLEILELDLDGGRALACVSGVGKVMAARAAALLVAAGATRRLLVVGVCGGLRRSLAPGDLIHCERAVQADSATRKGREVEADAGLLQAWRALAPGPQGWFLTADRPVLNPWRRLRLARAFAGPCAADMETAAAATVAREAGIPWAALRAVTDQAGFGSPLAFRRNFPGLAGRCADTVPGLLQALD